MSDVWRPEPIPGIDRDLDPVVEGVTLQERFESFHRINPHVYDALRSLALDLVARGRRRIGIGMVFEVLRWQRMMATSGDPWKLNNTYRAPYARLLMEREPALAGVFETRRSQVDGD